MCTKNNSNLNLFCILVFSSNVFMTHGFNKDICIKVYIWNIFVEKEIVSVKRDNTSCLIRYRRGPFKEYVCPIYPLVPFSIYFVACVICIY